MRVILSMLLMFQAVVVHAEIMGPHYYPVTCELDGNPGYYIYQSMDTENFGQCVATIEEAAALTYSSYEGPPPLGTREIQTQDGDVLEVTRYIKYSLEDRTVSGQEGYSYWQLAILTDAYHYSTGLTLVHITVPGRRENSGYEPSIYAGYVIRSDTPLDEYETLPPSPSDCDIYEPSDDTVNQVIDDVGQALGQSGLVQSIQSYYDVVAGGVCPVWQMPEFMGVGGGIPIDAQCSSVMNDVIYPVLSSVIMAVAGFVSIRWAVL